MFNQNVYWNSIWLTMCNEHGLKMNAWWYIILGVRIKFCKPDSLVFRHKLERPRYIPHHPLLHHISSNYQSPNSLFRPCIMCAFKTTKLTNRKNTFCMPPLNLSHFLGKLLLFYFLGSRTPDLKFMVGMWTCRTCSLNHIWEFRRVLSQDWTC